MVGESGQDSEYRAEVHDAELAVGPFLPRLVGECTCVIVCDCVCVIVFPTVILCDLDYLTLNGDPAASSAVTGVSNNSS